MHDSGQITAWRAKHYNATLDSVRWVHEELAIFRVRPDFPIPAHKAGQYVTLGMGLWEPRCDNWIDTAPDAAEKVLKRSYSITHPLCDGAGGLACPSEGLLDFYIVVVKSVHQPDHASLTPRLFMLKPGDRLNVGTKITGHYTADQVKPTDDVLFLSTGTGEAPNLYMLWELLNKGHQGKLVSINCVRYHRDLAYLEKLEALKNRFPRFQALHLTTRDQAGGKKYIQEYLKPGQLEETCGLQLSPATSHVFLCGNPAMIGVPTTNGAGEVTFPQPTGAIELLMQHGLTLDNPRKKIHGQIHFEEYW